MLSFPKVLKKINGKQLYVTHERLLDVHQTLQRLEHRDSISNNEWADATFHFLASLGYYSEALYRAGVKGKTIDMDIAHRTFGDHTGHKIVIRKPDGTLQTLGSILTLEPEDIFDYKMNSKQAWFVTGHVFPDFRAVVDEHEADDGSTVYQIVIRPDFMQAKGSRTPLPTGVATSTDEVLALMLAVNRTAIGMFEQYLVEMSSAIPEGPEF